MTKHTWLIETINEKDGRHKQMKAVDVFAAVIGYFYRLIMNRLSNGSGAKALLKNEIHWVLTIPAMWDRKARQLMRDAAEKVCRSTQLTSLT